MINNQSSQSQNQSPDNPISSTQPQSSPQDDFAVADALNSSDPTTPTPQPITSAHRLLAGSIAFLALFLIIILGLFFSHSIVSRNDQSQTDLARQSDQSRTDAIHQLNQSQPTPTTPDSQPVSLEEIPAPHFKLSPREQSPDLYTFLIHDQGDNFTALTYQEDSSPRPYTLVSTTSLSLAEAVAEYDLTLFNNYLLDLNSKNTYGQYLVFNLQTNQFEDLRQAAFNLDNLLNPESVPANFDFYDSDFAHFRATIIDQTLYLTNSDYARGDTVGVLLRSDDPDLKTWEFVAEKSVELFYRGDYLFAIKCFGDATWRGILIYTFNPETKNLAELIRVDISNIDIEYRLIDFDTRGNTYFAITEDQEFGQPTFLASVLSRSYHYPEQPDTVLISADQMPANISYIKLEADSNQLILVGLDESYTFDLDSHKLSKITDQGLIDQLQLETKTSQELPVRCQFD